MIEERVTPGTSPQNVFQEHIDRYNFALNYTKNKTVLDCACGTGYGSHLLTSNATSVTGVDISEEALTHAQENYSANNLKFIQSDACDLPFESCSFDVVVSFETLEHIPNYDMFLNECWRVLKRGGIFICSTPNAKVSSPKGKVTNPFHVKEFTYQEFLDLLHERFPVVELYGQRDVNTSKKYYYELAVKIKSKLGINKRILHEKQSVMPESYPVGGFNDGVVKSAYMVAVCYSGTE